MWKASTLGVREVTLGTFLIWLSGASEDAEPEHVAEQVGKLFPEELSKQRLAEYWDYLVHTRGLRENTANDRVSHVTQWWEWCYDHDDYGEHFPRVRRLDLPTVARERRPAPTWAQMDAAVWTAWNSRVPHYGDMFALERYTGLRVSQVLRLTWDDVDLKAARLRIRPELGKSRQERGGRVVPMAPALVEMLAGWGERDGLLIEWPETKRKDGGTHTQPGPCRNTLPELWKRSGAPPLLCRQPNHNFRRGFVTGLAAAGVSDEVRKALVGHSRGTHGQYTDVDLGLWERMVEAVALVPPIANIKAAVIPFRGGEER